MVLTYHYIVPPNSCLEKKKFAQCKEPWQYLAHLESLSYSPEIANHCFLSYTSENKKKRPTSSTPEITGCSLHVTVFRLCLRMSAYICFLLLSYQF